MESYILTLCLLLLPSIATSSKVVLLTRQEKTCAFGSDFIRNNHKLPNIAYDENLAVGAEDWAIRCALNNVMELSSLPYGENLFWSYGNSVTCENPLFSWYKAIKNFDYDNPKWTEDDGTFIQVVYSTIKKFGVGIASYKGGAFVVGRFDQQINFYGPFDEEHVPKPIKNPISKDDLTPKPDQPPRLIEVPIPEEEGWTEWVKTEECSVDCGVGTITEERWCVYLKAIKSCAGPRKRTVSCKKDKCMNCMDLDQTNCAILAKQNFCVHAYFGPWMKKNCMKSCNLCNAKSVKIEEEIKKD